MSHLCLGFFNQQRASFVCERTRKADVCREDELKRRLVVPVEEGQSATHHLVRDHPQAPPVYSLAMVVVFQYVAVEGGGVEDDLMHLWG